jgi:hypothetical protein
MGNGPEQFTLRFLGHRRGLRLSAFRLFAASLNCSVKTYDSERDLLRAVTGKNELVTIIQKDCSGSFISKLLKLTNVVLLGSRDQLRGWKDELGVEIYAAGGIVELPGDSSQFAESLRSDFLPCLISCIRKDAASCCRWGGMKAIYEPSGSILSPDHWNTFMGSLRLWDHTQAKVRRFLATGLAFARAESLPVNVSHISTDGVYLHVAMELDFRNGHPSFASSEALSSALQGLKFQFMSVNFGRTHNGQISVTERLSAVGSESIRGDEHYTIFQCFRGRTERLISEVSIYKGLGQAG